MSERASAVAPRVDWRHRWTAAALARRSLTVAVGAPLFIGAVWLGGWLFAAVVAVLAAAGALEFRQIARAAGLQPSRLAVVGAPAFPALAAAGRWDLTDALLPLIAVAAGALALRGDRRSHALPNAAADLLGAVYVGALLAYLTRLRGDLGLTVTLIVLATIWANDIAAYFAGVMWGRHKLAPAISPGKSVEGVIAGLAAAVAVAVGAGLRLSWPLPVAALIGLIVALAAVTGDLWESALKRSAGLKDSGGLLPGHGGVLDRFDAVLFGAPVGYYLVRWLT
ncbi:MAG: phosphatidate cytidylyltransferase [Armatimonadota bacterium]|nr:phosphatidate cytidylyltransferase [Armatimonadota bacterium]